MWNSEPAGKAGKEDPDCTVDLAESDNSEERMFIVRFSEPAGEAEGEDPDCTVGLTELDNSEPASEALEKDPDCTVDPTEPDNSELAGEAEEENPDWAVDEPENSEPAGEAEEEDPDCTVGLTELDNSEPASEAWEKDPDCTVDLAEPDNSEPAGKAEEEELDWAVDLTEPDNSEPAWKAQKRKFAKRKAQKRKTAKNKLEVEYDNRNVASAVATRLSRGESAIHMEEEASTVTPQTTENGSSPDFAVGNRVAVYWSDDDVYYEGVVTRKRKRDQIHIDYDDGESEWIYAKATKMKLLDGGLSGDREIKHDLANVKATLKVGSRVSVWWPAEKEYFDGTVGQIDRRKSKPHFLKYDDGDEEWIHLAHRKFIYGSRK